MAKTTAKATKKREPAPQPNPLEKARGKYARELAKKDDVLSGSTVYLSGPMDFVASRAEEKEFGWRNRVGHFLKEFGVRVYDPWNKPQASGLPHYGKEDELTTKKREQWSYDPSEAGDKLRAEIAAEYWPTLHIDLRMTDTADFLVAFCPTNIYSVGTVHEIATARLQHKPVLLVTPRVDFPAYGQLTEHLKQKGDKEGSKLLAELAVQAPLRENLNAAPSIWYMALVDPHYCFDGFGFSKYMKQFGWKPGALDEQEKKFPPQRPLLPYLEKVNKAIPKRYDLERNAYVDNDEWLIFEEI